jgi:transposase
MKDAHKHDLRIKAIRLYDDGIGSNEILRLMHRSDFRLTKWLRRFREFGEEGLRDLRRTPKHVRNRTRESIVRKIMALRDELAAHKTRRAAFTGIGAETIHHELYE